MTQFTSGANSTRSSCRPISSMGGGYPVRESDIKNSYSFSKRQELRHILHEAYELSYNHFCVCITCRREQQQR